MLGEVRVQPGLRDGGRDLDTVSFPDQRNHPRFKFLFAMDLALGAKFATSASLLVFDPAPSAFGASLAAAPWWRLMQLRLPLMHRKES